MKYLADGLSVAFTIPGWVLWGLLIALIVTVVTFGLMLLSSKIATDFGTGNNLPWHAFPATFVIIALAPSLLSAWVWSTGWQWPAILAGIGAYIFMWAMTRLISGLEQNRPKLPRKRA